MAVRTNPVRVALCAVGVAAAVAIAAGSFAIGQSAAGDDPVGAAVTEAPAGTAPDTSADPPIGAESSRSGADESTTDEGATDRADRTAADTGGDFVETFDGDTGLDRFRRGVYHRDVDAFGFAMEDPGVRTWTGDHDLDCGTPDSQRLLDKVDRDASFYTCRDHLMTSVGAVDSYSLAWFSPDQVFTSADTDTVSFDVNVTNLLARQWWEVVIVDPSESDLIAHPTVAGIDGTVQEGRPQMIPYPEGSIAVGNGPFAPGPIKINGENQGWEPVCTTEFALDPEGCDSKPVRRTFTVTDNRDGTVTVDFLDNSWTVDGEFPDEFKVVFKDHNYTPDKDGIPVGHTWHWDDISIS